MKLITDKKKVTESWQKEAVCDAMDYMSPGQLEFFVALAKTYKVGKKKTSSADLRLVVSNQQALAFA